MCGAMQEKTPNKKRHHESVDMFLISQLMIIVSGLYLGQITSKKQVGAKNWKRPNRGKIFKIMKNW